MSINNSDNLKRFFDLDSQCSRKSIVTHSSFLTPAEQYEINSYLQTHLSDSKITMSGGNDACERRILFCLPYYLEENSLDISEYIDAIQLFCRYGTPSHRDYLGAILSLGIRRDFIGDIWVFDNEAYIFSITSVTDLILTELKTVGRYGVAAKKISINTVPERLQEFKERTFTVMSSRLDAILGDLFGLSRSNAVKKIHEGAVNLNYSECLKPDQPVKPSDTISLRGAGKAVIDSFSGTTKRGRTIVIAKIYK